jgi:hypothetical protein
LPPSPPALLWFSTPEGSIGSQGWEEFSMTTRRLISTFLAMMVLLSTLTVGAASGVELGVATNPWVSIPWKVQTWESNYNASYFSVAFGGTMEHILLNFYPPTSGTKVFAIPDDYFLGNCGPGNGWSCFNAPQYGVHDKISEIDTYTFVNSFKVGWAYETSLYSDHISLAQKEFIDTLDYMASYDELVVDIPFLMGESNWTMYQAPSLAYDSLGRAHIALVIRKHDNSQDKLIYAHELAGGDTPTVPCNDEADTKYQCDFIYTTTTLELLGLQPKIAITNGDRPRIGYTLRGEGLVWKIMIAYPQTIVFYPKNCGPANAWHCLAIDESTIHFVIFPWFEMAIGPGNAQFAYQVTDPAQTYRTWIYHAKYVGTDGNCGSYLYLGNLRYAWECTQVVKVADATMDQYVASYSIQVDPNDCPVIAHQYTSDEFAPLRLELSYPSLRIGVEDGSWTHQVIDSGPYDTGKDVGLALNELGMGCMAYLEEIDYDPTVKLACQGPRAIFIPLVRK